MNVQWTPYPSKVLVTSSLEIHSFPKLITTWQYPLIQVAIPVWVSFVFLFKNSLVSCAGWWVKLAELSHPYSLVPISSGMGLSPIYFWQFMLDTLFSTNPKLEYKQLGSLWADIERMWSNGLLRNRIRSCLLCYQFLFSQWFYFMVAITYILPLSPNIMNLLMQKLCL